MPATAPIHESTVASLIARISADTPSPGCGVAAAVTFGLAAACAAKAAAITLRHSPDDQRLEQARKFFLECARVALDGAEVDRREFARQLKQNDPVAQARLASTSEGLIESIDRFDAELAAISARIRDNLSGDLFAARSLAAAARAVEENNLR
jgi:hypothetical protein